MKKILISTDNELRAHLGEAETLEELARLMSLYLKWSAEILYKIQEEVFGGIEAGTLNKETRWALRKMGKAPRVSKAFSRKVGSHRFIKNIRLVDIDQNDENEETARKALFTKRSQKTVYNLSIFSDILYKIAGNLRQEEVAETINDEGVNRNIASFIEYCEEEAEIISRFVNILDRSSTKEVPGDREAIEYHIKKILGTFSDTKKIFFSLS